MPRSITRPDVINKSRLLKDDSEQRQTAEDQQTARIILVEKHTLLCTALQRIVEAFSQVEMVAIFHTVDEALKIIEHTKVDAVVLGISVSITDCLYFSEYAREKQIDLEFVVIRLNLRPETVKTLVKQGIHGLLNEFASERDLADAISSVISGSLFLNKHAREILAISMSQAAIYLTAREMEVISLLKQGVSNFRIAQELHLKEKTVEAYLTRIYSKLGVNSRVEAIVNLENLYI